MSELMPISEARSHLSKLAEIADSEDVLLLKHGRPHVVMRSVRRDEAIMEELEDLRDRLSVHEREGVTMAVDKLAVELGIT